MGLGTVVASGAAWAQEAAATAAAAATETATAAVAAAPAAAAAVEATVNKGDVAWMMTSTLLVILMVVPGLALFYGGLVRAKNMLSVLMQVMVVFSLASVLWAVYGYTLAFGGEGLIIGNLDKAFLAGITLESLSATFTPGVDRRLSVTRVHSTACISAMFEPHSTKAVAASMSS